MCLIGIYKADESTVFVQKPHNEEEHQPMKTHDLAVFKFHDKRGDA